MGVALKKVGPGWLAGREHLDMAIRSDNFRGVVLTDEDAQAFERQIKDTSPNEAARRALARGEELLREAQFRSLNRKADRW